MQKKYYVKYWYKNHHDAYAYVNIPRLPIGENYKTGLIQYMPLSIARKLYKNINPFLSPNQLEGKIYING